MLMTRRNGFGNEEGVSAGEKQLRCHNFAENGFPCLGSWDDMQNRLGWESYMHAYNMARDRGAEPNCDQLTFVNLKGKTVCIDPLPFDPKLDAEEVAQKWGLFCNLHYNNATYNLRMTKSLFKNVQERGVTALLEAQAIDAAAVSSSLSSGTKDKKPLKQSQGAVRLGKHKIGETEVDCEDELEDCELEEEVYEVSSIAAHMFKVNILFEF
jgi:hypothetical protein